MTKITYVLATENGQYNPTVPYNVINLALNIIGRYKNVEFIRINDWKKAGLKVVNAKSLNAWATFTRSTKTIHIHPSVNYGQNPTTFTKILQHELGHWLQNGHHNDPNGLMHPTAGIVFNWGSVDEKWMRQWSWKSRLRPWDNAEKNMFRDMYETPRAMNLYGNLVDGSATEGFKCDGPHWLWDRFARQPQIVSVAEVNKLEASEDLRILKEVLG